MKVPDHAESKTASRSSGGLAQALLHFFEEFSASAHGLIEVHADRIRLSVRRKIVQALIGTGVGLCAAIFLGAAALATLRGMCGGFSALWGGCEWLGDLCGGLFALTLAAGAVALYLRLSSHRELERLKAKYEVIRSQSEDRDGVARSRGGAGDPAPDGLDATSGR